jgi:hypothetical protein
MNKYQQNEPATRGAGLGRWGTIKFVVVIVAVLLAVGLYASYRFSPNRPAVQRSIEDHFKYGSIGSDFISLTDPNEEGNGLPLTVMKVLPRMFPNHLPNPPPAGPKDYTAFGFIQEEHHPLPIGFGTRRCGIDLVGINCAACHVGSVRESVEKKPDIYLAMPANTVDLQAFFEFLFACADDPRFTPEEVLAEVEKDGPLFPLDRQILLHAVPQMKTGLLKRRDQLAFFLREGHPRFGPGRVDTFNPYKSIQFRYAYPEDRLPPEEEIGTVDFPSIWNQKPREGMHLHWDGDNTSVRERNVSAAFGAGATKDHVDLPAIDRLMHWLMELPPPKFPFPDPADEPKAARGQSLYVEYCFRCHSMDGAEVGQVVPLDEIGTDPYRLNAYTEKLEGLQHGYDKGYP